MSAYDFYLFIYFFFCTIFIFIQAFGLVGEEEPLPYPTQEVGYEAPQSNHRAPEEQGEPD